MVQINHTPPLPLTEDIIRASIAGSIPWRSLITTPGDDLVTLPSTAPGRPRTFLLQPELGTAPFSCELIVYNNSLFSGLLKPVSRFLRCGAGVKVILDELAARMPANPRFEWRFNLAPDHPDYQNLSPEQKQYLYSPKNPEKFEPDYFLYVYDSMERDESLEYPVQGKVTIPLTSYSYCSIEDSWQELIEAAINGDKVVIDLSSLRAHGEFNSKGLMASGPIGLGKKEKKGKKECSFLSIYKTLADYLIQPEVRGLLILLGTVNDTLRRGGFKRGIVTTAMDWRNPNFVDYLNVPLVSLPGGHKKGARVTPDICDRQDLLRLLSRKRNEESIFLAKIFQDYYDNVCQGLGIVNFGTCLIWRFNVGAVDVMSDIPAWMERVAEQLSLLHLNWRSELPHIAKIVAPQTEDLQVGLDIMGVANGLGRWGISYTQFAQALEDHNQHPERYENVEIAPELYSNVERLVYWLAQGYQRSTKTCDRLCDLYNSPRFLRIHTPSEPAQNHSYETRDSLGHHTCRAIFAPAGQKTRNGVRVRRVSDHQKNILAYHGHVETAVEVGPQLHEKVCSLFTEFVGINGRSHGYMSFDDWAEMCPERLKEWILNSPLQSMYYAEHKNYNQNYLSKTAPSLNSIANHRDSECAVCAD